MSSKAMKFVSKYYKTANNYDKSFQKLKLLNIADGNVTAELKIEEEHLNLYGTLHGGCSSALMDALSLFGVTTHNKVAGYSPVSADLHLTFLKGVKLGDEVLIDSKTVRVEKSLAFCEIQMLNKKTNEILIKGTQTAFLTQEKREM